MNNNININNAPIQICVYEAKNDRLTYLTMETSDRSKETIESITQYIKNKSPLAANGLMKSVMLDGKMITKDVELQEILKNPNNLQSKFTVYPALIAEINP